MVIRKLNELTENYQKLQGNYNELTANYMTMKKEIQTINKGQEEMKNTISELKNTVEGIKSGLDEQAGGQGTKNSLDDQQRKKGKNNKEELREMRDNMKHKNISIIRIPEGKKEEEQIENLLEKVMTENFPNFMRDKVIKVQEAHTVSIKRNQNRPTPRHIIIKMAKFKDK